MKVIVGPVNVTENPEPNATFETSLEKLIILSLPGKESPAGNCHMEIVRVLARDKVATSATGTLYWQGLSNLFCSTRGMIAKSGGKLARSPDYAARTRG